MKYRAVLFDLDGVLCHTDRFHYQAWREIADSLGIPFDERSNDRLRGVSRMESLAIILQGYSGHPLSPADKEVLADKKNRLYRARLETMRPDDLTPEVDHLLTWLVDNRIQTAVASSSRNAMLILERLGIRDRFDAIVDGNQIDRSKPDPEVFLKAAERLGLPPAHCLVVEDAGAGVEAARSGGFDCAGIGDVASAAGVTYPIQALPELIEILRIANHC